MHNKLLLKLFNYNNKFNFFKKTSNLVINNNQTIKIRKYSTEMDLKLVVKRLEQYANLKLAADWDNVGLLVEPSENLLVKRILITNDLTEPVLEEAIKSNANLIISYHPAIFNPLKRLTKSEWKQRSIVKCIENRIAVYSPHTAWDSVEGGINDWILSVFDLKKSESIEPVKEAINPCGFSKTLKINVDFGPSKDKLLSKLSGYQDNIRFVGEQR
jgi:dinuclear metal center YbgI/SA1388 family protein